MKPKSPTVNDETEQTLDKVAAEIHGSLVFPQSSRTAPIPEFDSLVDLILRLKAIVYPGFRSNESSSEKVLVGLRSQIDETHQLISRQIAIAIARHFEACEDMTYQDCGGISSGKLSMPDNIMDFSQRISTEYILKMPQIRASLLTDVKAAYVGDPACKNYDEVILCYPGLSAITVHRLAHELYKLNVPFIPRMMAEWVHGETGVDIHPGATIGNHFFIDHGTGVVIGETCIIGEHVKIYQGVTLGALSFPQDEMGQLVRDSKRHPTIEDNVVIYANATVLGGNTVVGQDSVIGSSVWLTESVAPSTTVTMEKPKLKIRNQVDS
ncbi:MAG: serine acetyltransferase [Mariniblastus sp.]|jgi:serine O-acetyltransferase|nr:serine acetyltransferase [Mariniblastus sp.]